MKKPLLLALAAIGLLVALAVPVGADSPGGGNPIRGQLVQVQTDAGYVGASWNSQWGNDLVVAHWSGPDWFRCASFGHDVLMPSLRKQGPGKAVVSGSFTPDDFDECWGSPEAWDIAFEFEMTAGQVVISNSIGHTNEQYLRGDQTEGMDYRFRAHHLVGYDVTAEGVMFGNPIGLTDYGHFSASSHQSEGP